MRLISPFLLIGLLLYSSIPLFPQRATIDSLRHIYKEQLSDSGRVNILIEISKVYMDHRPDSALVAANEGLQITHRSKDVEGEMMILKQIADVYRTTGDYPRSLEFYFQRLKLDESRPDPERTVVTLISIANLYQLEGDYEKALLYAKKGDSLISKDHLDSYQWYSYLGFGDLYEKMDSLPQAMLYNEKAYQIAVAAKDTSLQGMSLNNMANVYNKAGKPDTALQLYRQCIPFLEQSANASFLCESYQGIAKALFVKGQTAEAIAYAGRSIDLAKSGGFNTKYLTSVALLTDFYKKTNQIDSAFFYQEQMINVKDSLFSQEKIRQIQNLSFNEQMRQQEIEYGKQQLKATYRIYSLVASLAIFLLITFMLWRNNRYKQRAFSLLQRQKQETDSQKQIAETALEELKAAQHQLILSEKMASLGELTAGIAHEIQNPLNFVNNFSEVSAELLDEAKLELKEGNKETAQEILDDVQQNLQKIVTHGKRADSIVKGMLAHSRKSTGQKEPVDINNLADECLRLSYHGMRARDKAFNVVMNTTFDHTAPKINIVPQEIGRVFLNLLNNAFYAVNDKKKSTPADYKPAVNITTSHHGGKVYITIEDNGIGIPQEMLNKILQPFFTTKPSGEGTGLGLSLSYDIVKAHGGDIKITTTPGKGASFTVILPV